MIQDIYPSRLNNQYTAYSPVDEDIVFFFQGSSLLAKYEDEETLVYPQYKEFVKGITLQEIRIVWIIIHYISSLS